MNRDVWPPQPAAVRGRLALTLALVLLLAGAGAVARAHAAPAPVQLALPAAQVSPSLPAPSAAAPTDGGSASVWENPLLLAGRPAEADLGRQLHEQMIAGNEYGPPVEDARAQAVFAQLLPVAGAVRDNITYTLTVFAADEPAAFSLPGGFVYATTGLVAALDDQQLAGVLAHELVHTVYSHSLLHASVMNSLERLAGVLVPRGEAQGLLADIGRYLLSLGYSRSQEAEADRVGQAWAHAAGFDPRGLPEALRILDDQPGPSGVAAYFSSHPATQERIAALEEAAAQLETGSAPPEAAALPGNRLIALVALLVAALAQALHA